MIARRRTSFLAAVLAAIAASANAAASDEPEGAHRDEEVATHDAEVIAKKTGPARGRQVDATYGRIDGDLGVALGAGATVAPRGVRAALDLRLRYLDTVGVFAGYEEGGFNSDMDPRRVLAGGVEIRPLFIARWLNGYEWGSPRADLTVDSLGLELGAFVAQPVGGAFAARPGFQLGFGVETPILERASGPWVGFHGGARWSDTVLGGADAVAPSDRSLFLTITLSWHARFGAHVVDMNDRAPK